jgi:SET domain-containing protein
MPKIYVANSSVHGSGVFAGEFIPCGTVVGKYLSRRVSLKNEHPHVLIIYDEDTGEELERRIGTNQFRYVNHSIRPNLEMLDDTLEFVATRHIAPNEELTWYYGEEFEADMGAE